ncbi:MAG: hypothetical protein JXA91_08635 [Candidatus Thermoplasmatota archaeon]|nr:hypothetical protein [Candidatus Thermoplasmatota archaeon]
MKEKDAKKKEEKSEFNPRIVVGIVGSSDLDTLNSLKDFFSTLDGFSIVYMRTSGSPLYITDKKPNKETSGDY